MNRVFIALGSNKGETDKNLRLALNSIQTECDLIRISKFYRTKAENMALGHDHEFLNAVCEITTSKSPIELLNFLMGIEKQTGRIREKSEGYLARELDLDILLFNDEVLTNDNLIIPHPQMTNRLFVLQPLFEIAPDLMISGTEKTVRYFYDLLMVENSHKSDEVTV